MSMKKCTRGAKWNEFGVYIFLNVQDVRNGMIVWYIYINSAQVVRNGNY